MALPKDTGATTTASSDLEVTWNLAGESSRFPRPKLGGLKQGWGEAQVYSKRRAGNWLRAASETSLVSGATSGGGGSFFSARDMQGLGASGMDTDPAEGEPELVRIASLESEADSEALARLFGRTTTLRRGALPLPSSPLKPNRPSSLFSHSPSVTSPDRSGPSSPLPALCEDPNPPSPGAHGAEPSPRDSQGSAASCHRHEAGAEAHSGCHVSATSAARSAGSDAAAPRCAPRVEDPTCAVDHCGWSQLSLEAILGAVTGCQEGGACREEEAEELSPRDVLSSSVLDLISDPAVKAKIQSLQLYTGVGAPCVPSFEVGPLGSGAPSREAEGAQRRAEDCEEGREGEWEGEEEGCETTDSEGSPPPLARRLTVKREAALEDCWLTGAQRRRKAAAMMGSGEDGELFDSELKRRRVSGREQEFSF